MLSAYTGWGGYGIQLAQALLEEGRYVPRLLARNDRTQHCDLHWLEALQYLEDHSRPLMQQVAAAEGWLPAGGNAGVTGLFCSWQPCAASWIQRRTPRGRDLFDAAAFGQ